MTPALRAPTATRQSANADRAWRRDTRPGASVLPVRFELAVLAVLVVVGAALRVFLLNNQSLWTDEIVTFRSSDGPLWWVISQTEVNSNILPLYYVVAAVSLTPGNNEVMLRLPSVIFGVLSIPLVYLIAREWFGTQVALLSTVLFVFSPFHVWYS